MSRPKDERAKPQERRPPLWRRVPIGIVIWTAATALGLVGFVVMYLLLSQP